MMYSEIEIPSQGDGRTMVLIGNGYFRGERLAAIHYRIAAALIDVAIFYVVYLPFFAVASLLELGLVDALGTLLAIAVTVANIVVMQAMTGQSFGKMCFGMIVVHPRVEPMDAQHYFYAIPGAGMLIFRSALQLTCFCSSV